MTQLPQPVWQTIGDYLKKYRSIEPSDELREKVEQMCDVRLFDGGCFIARGNEFDLFVIPEKRGQWRIRSTITTYLNDMLNKYGNIIVKIYDDNAASLRLARHFGFREVDRTGNMIRLEKYHG